jgi:hypothetical protein
VPEKMMSLSKNKQINSLPKIVAMSVRANEKKNYENCIQAVENYQLLNEAGYYRCELSSY